MNSPWLSLTLLGIGFVVIIVCGIYLLFIAFQKNPLWVLANLFIPFASLVFIIKYWEDTKSAFCGHLCGLALCVAGLVMTPHFSESFWKGYHAGLARAHGQAAPTDDLTAQIQAHRQKLEALQATFALDGVEITKQYQSLDAQRKALKPDDAVAITKFNEAAAAYQAKNTARKEMQGQIETTQHELDSLLDTRSRQMTKAASSNKKVVMYATTHCPACEMARQYFVKNGVRYEEINVEGNRASYDEFKRLGGNGVPLILVGNQKFEGFNAFKLDLALR